MQGKSECRGSFGVPQRDIGIVVLMSLFCFFKNIHQSIDRELGWGSHPEYVL